MRRTAKQATKSCHCSCQKSTRVVSGRRHHRLRMLVDHLISKGCENPRNETESPHCSRSIPQSRAETHASTGRRRRNRRCPGSVLQGLLSPGSSSLLLVAVMYRWPSFSRFGSRKLPRFHPCFTGWRQLTLARTRRAMPAPVWECTAAELGTSGKGGSGIGSDDCRRENRHRSWLRPVSFTTAAGVVAATTAPLHREESNNDTSEHHGADRSR